MSVINENLISVFGIQNGGSHCYMNSVLQLLFSVKEFREFIIMRYQFFLDQITRIHGQPSDNFKNNYIFEALHNILEQQFGGGTVVDPTLLRNILQTRFAAKFNINVQNDAYEFLNLFIKELHREFYCIENAVDLTSVTDDSVSNQLSFISYTFKLNYSYFYNDTQHAYEIQADNNLTQQFNMDQYVIVAKIFNNYKQTYSLQPELQQLINISLGSQIMDSPTNGQYVVKKRIRELPKYIIIYIPRYDDYLNKILTRINIPTTINIYDRAYNITSIVCHDGKHLDSGHYENFSKRGNKWYSLNDSAVKDMCWEEIFDKVCIPNTQISDTDYSSCLLLCEMTEQFEDLTYHS